MKHTATPVSGYRAPLFSVGLAGLLVFASWFSRDLCLAWLAPYGLATCGTITVADEGSAIAVHHDELTSLGWVAVGAALIGAAAALVVVSGVGEVRRWRATGGAGTVPKIPVSAGAIGACAVVFLLLLLLIGRDQTLFATVGPAVSVAAGIVVGWLGSRVKQHWRHTQAFAARVDPIMGHSRPAVHRVRASAWNSRIAGPRKLVIRTGPGWQHKPAELAALNRCVREFAWPVYKWSYDPRAGKITGTVG